MTSFKSVASSTQNTDIPPLSSGLSKLDNLYNANNGSGTIATVLVHLQYINATVLVLDNSTQAAYNQLKVCLWIDAFVVCLLDFVLFQICPLCVSLSHLIF